MKALKKVLILWDNYYIHVICRTEISEVPHEGDLIFLGEVSNNNVLDLFESFHVSVGQFLHADVTKEQLKNKI
ncbi:hypothetical protein QJS10_CPB12g01568 [Acorus calamus]|uniref:Uncharacterized protein n=1 Tax=Acorus calamus TaxID=4465 RepID=A0AAV9DNH4_ACOCL|nr:hypothetical protein QJS10_CPB12g01568 [Acorus calamus]